jgi:hypothetical protein
MHSQQKTVSFKGCPHAPPHALGEAPSSPTTTIYLCTAQFLARYLLFSTFELETAACARDKNNYFGLQLQMCTLNYFLLCTMYYLSSYVLYFSSIWQSQFSGLNGFGLCLDCWSNNRLSFFKRGIRTHYFSKVVTNTRRQ